MKTIEYITIEEFKEILDERLMSALSIVKQEQHDVLKESFVTRRDIAGLFGISLVTVNAWMKKGLLPFHRISSRVYFKKSEVLASLNSVGKYKRN